MALRSFVVLLLILLVLSVFQVAGLPLHLRFFFGDDARPTGPNALVAVIIVQADGKTCAPEVVRPLKVTVGGTSSHFAAQNADGSPEYHVFANTRGGRLATAPIVSVDLVGPGIDRTTTHFVHPGYGVVIHTVSVTLATTGFRGRLVGPDDQPLEGKSIGLALRRSGQSEQNVVTTTTGQDGRFAIDKVMLPARVAGVGAVEGFGEVEWTPSVAAPLPVSSDDDIVLRFALSRRMAVTVRAKGDPENSPSSPSRRPNDVPVFVSAWPLDPGTTLNELLAPSRRGPLQATETLMVPKSGRYRIEALAPNFGYAVAEFDFGDPAMKAITFEFAAPAEPLRGVLKRGGVVAGNLFVVDGTPSWEVIRPAREYFLRRARTRMQNRPQNPPIGAFDITSAGGRFELRAHSPDQREVTVVLPGVGFSRIAKSAIAAGPVELIDDPEAPRIEGRVTDPNGLPVAGVEIVVTTHRGLGALDTHHVDPIGRFPVRTDADGRYLMTGLLEGDYDVRAIVRRPPEEGEVIGLAAPVRTEKGRPARADFTTKEPSGKR